MSKQYGLIVPNKNKSLHPMGVVRPTSVFGDDSDSDSGSAKPTGLKRALKRQDRLLQEKAVEEDPTVYQYDELYDDMDAKRKESKLSRKDLDKKPKYISRLLATAERRKRENERRIERQVQKEREAEGEEFKDKESFVTSAYRAKLEELKKLDEEEKREEYLEAIGDVKKQGNLDGFYRHLYDQKVLYEEKANADEDKAETSKSEANVEIKEEKIEEDEDEEKGKNKTHIKTNQKKRKYRRRDENSESEPETTQIEQERSLQHLPSNIDADSDFSIDSSDTDEDNEAKKTKATTETAEENNDNNETKQQVEIKTEKKEEKDENVKEEAKESYEKAEKEEIKVVKPKINIWKKRTVGEVFDEALKRYFERKALREAGTYVRPTL